MLSIIVSSYKSDLFCDFSQNIKQTIGDNFQYEIIQIWNPGLMGICEAYNKGAEDAIYDSLLFVHEDIYILTENWGIKLLNHLINKNIGVIGLAGSNIKTIFPIAWWDIKEGYGNNIYQLNNNKVWVFNELKEDKDAIILDGVFLAISKEKWVANNFDINNKSFHGYDVRFCFDISKKYQNKIISDIKIKHFSQGNGDIKWFKEICSIYYCNKWIFSKNDLSLIEIDIFLGYLKKYKFSKFSKINYFFKFYSPFNYSLINNLKIIRLLVYYI